MKASIKILNAILLTYACVAFADDVTNSNNVNSTPNALTGTADTSKGYFVSLYQPTFILPFYYTETPYQSVYNNVTPDDQKINNTEVNYQFSFKVPVAHDLFSWPDNLYIAYTQESFWQLYNYSAFFRETDYQPEVFLDNEFNQTLFNNWQLSDVDVGAVHQSNGEGGELERSWNRIYLDGMFTNNNWLFSLKPWYLIFKGESSSEHNPQITDYMGYGEEMVAYKYGENTFSLSTRNDVESGFARGAEWLTWSFPLIHHNIKGYVYAFSGYGQSLIEYDHYTNAVGVGIGINDWTW